LDLFEGFLRAGTASKSWLTIFSLLHRLRQTCDHVALTIKAHQDQDEWDEKIAAQQEQQKEDIAETPSEAIDQRVSCCFYFQIIYYCIWCTVLLISFLVWNAQFLGDLMNKFKAMESKKSKNDNKLGDESYASNIANMLNNAVQKKSSALEEECSICLEPINICESVVTPCFHLFCKDCLVGVLKGRPSQSQKADANRICPNGPCPVCTEEIDSSKILRISESDGEIRTSYLLSSAKPTTESSETFEEDEAARHALETAVQGSSSAKLSAILEELDNVWKEDPGSKVLIFSQFLGFLDLIGHSLKSNKIPTSRLDGKLSLKERVAVLKQFGSAKRGSGGVGSESKNRVGSVLLISMKAGGVGLNLVAASTVFIVDPWWNAAVEDQCVDRIHRIGQTAEKVRVRKFCVRDSVEERILELQKRKKNIASQVLCDKGEAGAGGSGSRPTMDDLKILFGS
jgi:SNF2 family DNA or RNA helicase